MKRGRSRPRKTPMSDLQFDPIAHRYTLGDRVLPSVSQITGTIAPLVGIPLDVLDAKRDLGVAVHLATQYYDEGDLDRDALPKPVIPYLEAYILFREITGFLPTHIEYRVYSEDYGFAGTLDRVGTFTKFKSGRNGRPCVIDLKSTYRLAPIYGVQTALYEYAFTGRAINNRLRRFALQLKPGGIYRLEEFRDPSDLSVGLAALTLLNWRARNV